MFEVPEDILRSMGWPSAAGLDNERPPCLLSMIGLGCTILGIGWEFGQLLIEHGWSEPIPRDSMA